MQIAVSIKIQKFCYHGNVTPHFSRLDRLNLKVEKELVNFQLFAGNIEKISAIKNAKLLGGKKCKAIHSL